MGLGQRNVPNNIILVALSVEGISNSIVYIFRVDCFCLPFSNAVVERLFSHVKNIKTDKRTCLDESTLAGLLHVKHGMKRNCETASTFRMNDEMKRCVKKVIASATSDEVKARKTGV